MFIHKTRNQWFAERMEVYTAELQTCPFHISFSSSLLSFLFQYVVVLSAAIHNKQPVTLRSSQSSGHKTSKIIFSGKFSNSSVCVGMLILAQHINLLLTPLKKCQIDKILSSEAEAYGSCCE